MTKRHTKDQFFASALMAYRISHLIHGRLDKVLRPFDLNVAGWLMLKCIELGKEQGFSPTAISAATEMSLPQVAITSKQLIKLHLVRQRTQEHDQRSRHLILTERGQSQLKRINREISRLDTAVKNQIGGDNLQSINNLIDQLAHILREA